MKNKNNRGIPSSELKTFQLKYINHLKAKKKKDKKYIMDMIDIDQILEIFISFLKKEKVYKAEEINNNILDKYFSYLIKACFYDKEIYKTATSLHLSYLNNFFDWLLKKKLIKKNPFDDYRNF